MLIDGRMTEGLFTHLMRKLGYGHIVHPTKEQDMFEHWDIQIEGVKYDVKSIKKESRHDNTTNEEIIWVEFQNVRGNPGWLYGKADMIAFEVDKGFLLVPRTSLLERSLELKTDQKGKDFYQQHTRHGRQDIVVKIRKEDIKDLVTNIIYK
jgi:hypothetical protein